MKAAKLAKNNSLLLTLEPIDKFEVCYLNTIVIEEAKKLIPQSANSDIKGTLV